MKLQRALALFGGSSWSAAAMHAYLENYPRMALFMYVVSFFMFLVASDENDTEVPRP